MPPLTEAPPEAFAEGEDFEFRLGDAARAAAYYERLAARTPDPALSGSACPAGANGTKLGQVDQALGFYDSAQRVTGVAIAGVPVDLLARWARCELLATTDRAD